MAMPEVTNYRERKTPEVDVVPLVRELQAIQYVDDIDGVVEVMHAIQPTLRPAGLQEDFHDMYTDVSERVAEAKRRSKFRRPDMIDRTSPPFARLYTDELDHYAQDVLYRQTGSGDPNGLRRMLHAWQLGLTDLRLPDVPSGVRTVLGVNAHIVVDLGKACYTSNPDDDYFIDYMFAVTGILNDVIKERVVDQIPGDDLLCKGLVPWIEGGIFAMRYQAWLDYKRLKRTPESKHPALIREFDNRAVMLNRAALAVGPLALGAMAKTESLGLSSVASLPALALEWVRPGFSKLIQSAVALPVKYL